MTKLTKKKNDVKNSSTASLSHTLPGSNDTTPSTMETDGNGPVVRQRPDEDVRTFLEVRDALCAFVISNDAVLFEVSRMDEEVPLKKWFDAYLLRHPRPETAKQGETEEDANQEDDDQEDPDKLSISKQMLVKMFESVAEKMARFSDDMDALEPPIQQDTVENQNEMVGSSEEPVQSNSNEVTAADSGRQSPLAQDTTAGGDDLETTTVPPSEGINPDAELSTNETGPANQPEQATENNETSREIANSNPSEVTAVDNLTDSLPQERQNDVTEARPQTTGAVPKSAPSIKQQERAATAGNVSPKDEPKSVTARQESETRTHQSVPQTHHREALRMPQNILQIQARPPKPPPKYANPLLEEIPVSIRNKLIPSFASNNNNLPVLSVTGNNGSSIKLPRVDRVPIAMYHATSRRQPTVEEDKINGTRHPISYLKEIGPRRAQNPAPSNTLAPALCIKPVK